MATGPRSRPFGTAPACRLVKAAELQGVPQAEAVLRSAALRLVHDRSRDGRPRDAADGRREHRRSRRRARARRLRRRPEVEQAYQSDRAEARIAGALLGQARPHRRQRRARPLHRAEPRAARRRARAHRSGLPAVRGRRRARDEPRAAGRAAARCPRSMRCSRPTPAGSTTAEVARVLADTTNEPDLAEAEDELIRLAVAGGAKRQPARSRRALDRRLDAIRTVRNVRLAARSRS